MNCDNALGTRESTRWFKNLLSSLATSPLPRSALRSF